mmetsp:Transcript_28659/g.44878  ORF Transcript_28659/g.44878 Transcript_28659/m.44878 type:complete len:1164 (-) Transcript_28659:1820-5311(-)
MALSQMQLVLALGLLALGCVSALEGLSGPGGTFRFGHVYWQRDSGNTISFTIEAAFTRNVETSYFQGTAADGFAQVGDRITMTGRETPIFDFGDGIVHRLDNLVMTVIAYSESENWILGSTTLPGHTYATPNDQGTPWLAKFSGCCRLRELHNNADAPWVLTVEVDILRARASPRVTTLPQLSVPYDGSPVSPTFRLFGNSPIPETDPDSRRIEHWELAQPWDVGQAGRLQGMNSSTVELPLRTISSTAMLQGVAANKGCQVYFASQRSLIFQEPGQHASCMMRLLRGDYYMNITTIEGWVRVMRNPTTGKEGGAILSTGEESGNTPSTFGRVRTCTSKGNCAVSLIYASVNSTHVVVGHERFEPHLNKFKLSTVAFSVSSSQMLVEELKSTELYPPVFAGQEATDDDFPLRNKWVHVTIVRKSHIGHDNGLFTSWEQTYKVYVNGYQLEVDKYPACTDEATCTGGARGSISGYNLGTGESNPIPGPRIIDASVTLKNGRCDQDPSITQGVESGIKLGVECLDDGGFGNGTALIIGGYRGADPDMQAHYFLGEMDEVRIWHGERSRAQILASFQTPLNPAREDFYGDPSKVAINDISTYDSSVAPALFALYSFDDQNIQNSFGSCGILPSTTGTGMSVMQPVYPKFDESAYDTPGSIACAWLAKVYVNSMWGISSVVSGTGTSNMFYDSRDIFALSQGVVSLQTTNLKIGFYQITVLGAIAALDDAGDRPTPRVPIDFIIQVVDSNNVQVPKIKAYAYTEEIGDNTVFVRPTGQSVELPYYPRPTQQEMQQELLRAYAGFEVYLLLRGQDERTLNGALDTVYNKVGFTIGPAPPTARFTTVKGPMTDTTEGVVYFDMDMNWTPCDVNMVQTICFDSTNRYEVGAQDHTVQQRVSSEMMCVNLELIEDPAPTLSVIPEVDPVTGVEFTMGRKGMFTVQGTDENCLDDVTITMSGGTMPPGAMFGEQMAVSGSCVQQSRAFEWTPDINMGGFKTTLTFMVQDTGGAKCSMMTPKMATTDVLITVKRCRYVVQEDMQLQELAAVLGMDWIRLWSLNSREPSLNHPDYLILVDPPQEIYVGHRYKVLAPTEPLGGIMKRFGMTDMQLHQLNYDLANATEVEQGMELCVVPNSCTGMRNTIYSGLVYEDGRFFAQERGDSNPVPHTSD